MKKQTSGFWKLQGSLKSSVKLTPKELNEAGFESWLNWFNKKYAKALKKLANKKEE